MGWDFKVGLFPSESELLPERENICKLVEFIDSKVSSRNLKRSLDIEMEYEPRRLRKEIQGSEDLKLPFILEFIRNYDFEKLRKFTLYFEEKKDYILSAFFKKSNPFHPFWVEIEYRKRYDSDDFVLAVGSEIICPGCGKRVIYDIGTHPTPLDDEDAYEKATFTCTECCKEYKLRDFDYKLPPTYSNFSIVFSTIYSYHEGRKIPQIKTLIRKRIGKILNIQLGEHFYRTH